MDMTWRDDTTELIIYSDMGRVVVHATSLKQYVGFLLARGGKATVQIKGNQAYLSLESYDYPDVAVSGSTHEIFNLLRD